ncbi:BglG family transcription antiterminator [Sporolactobacillus spathodeae]|uniref:Mannitol operon transcriptional antiterminator n=1 Tax=Sporolactobacillus spathodeae TaxID=1465502 RepID=A0ABS2QAD9_9BACL|nr:transcription antiterminator [Sporolactobacillus spathodeae]MBM7658757.1 mannitol operon transcriptional antiterminator [Sporolactobacillus spathodeae]
MFLTNREKAIIELLLKTSGRHTTLSIASYLQVSVRTVIRDLKKIEKTLDPLGLRLEQEKNNSLRITGPDQSVYKLVQKLSTIQPLDLSTKERRLLLLLEAMRQNEPIKIGPLAKDLGISVTTLASYLNDLDEWLKDFDLSLVRKRGVGLQLEGTERSKRMALGNFYLTYFNEELIEEIFRVNKPEDATKRLILHYFKPNYLAEIDRVTRKYIREMYAELADSDYIGFLLQVCIAYQRYASGHQIGKPDQLESNWSENTEAYPIINQITSVLEERLTIRLSEWEKTFLTIVLRSSRFQNAESLYYDRVITGQNVKQLIQHVSKKLHWDMTRDFSLFQGLLAHLEPSVFRIRKNMPAPNPLTDQVKAQFPTLFSIVSECLDQVFPDIAFPDEETAYIVLHFGAAIEQGRKAAKIRTLVVCPTGIGASRMLATLLNKEFPEAVSLSVSSIGDMNKLDLHHFELILTTVHLPKQPIPCILVNPLLSKENIKEIREVIHGLQKQHLLPVPFSKRQKKVEKKQERPLEALMNKTETAIRSIRGLLRDFQVMTLQQADTVEEVLQTVMNDLKEKRVVGDPDQVVRKLLMREKVAGLAIPETTMALYHCLDQTVDHITFQIAHTETAFRLLSMDGSYQVVSDILILIAPDPMTPLEQEIISTVSASLVADRESMLLFASANEKLIRTKLENNFYQFLLNKLSKD